MWRSPFRCLFLYFSGPAKPIALSARPPNIETANAPAVPRLSRSRRVSVEPWTAGSSWPSMPTSFCRDSLPERAACKALDEAVEERVVEERERDARNQRGGHDRLPVEDVAHDQVVWNARRDGPVRRAGDERERIDELVHTERERKDDDGQDPRERNREDDAPKRTQARAAVDEGRVLELLRDRLEEPHQQPRRERDRERRVDEDQRPERVLHVELGDDPGERKEEQRRRDQVNQEDADTDALAPPARKSRERVSGR